MGAAAEPDTHPEKIQDVLVPWVLQGGERVFHRYYHLFEEGELRDLVRAAAEEEGFEMRMGGEEGGGKWVRVKAEGWEADNWWLEGEVGVGPVMGEEVEMDAVGEGDEVEARVGIAVDSGGRAKDTGGAGMVRDVP